MKINTIKGEIVCPFCGEVNPEIKGRFEETREINFILDRTGRRLDIVDEEIDSESPDYRTTCCGQEDIYTEEALDILNGEYVVSEDDLWCLFDISVLDDKIEIKRTRKKRINPKKLLVNKLK